MKEARDKRLLLLLPLISGSGKAKVEEQKIDQCFPGAVGEQR